jgi:hypothetical protein
MHICLYEWNKCIDMHMDSHHIHIYMPILLVICFSWECEIFIGTLLYEGQTDALQGKRSLPLTP